MTTKPILCHERHPLRTRLAFDSAPSALARKPATSTKPSASPKPSTLRKPATDVSRQEGLQAILDFLSGALSPTLFAEVEAELERYVRGSQDPDTTDRPAADRRRIAGDSAGESSFFARFPAAKKIGAA